MRFHFVSSFSHHNYQENILVIDVNEWINNKCKVFQVHDFSAEHFLTDSLVHIHQKERVPVEINITTCQYKQGILKWGHALVYTSRLITAKITTPCACFRNLRTRV